MPIAATTPAKHGQYDWPRFWIEHAGVTDLSMKAAVIEQPRASMLAADELAIARARLEAGNDQGTRDTAQDPWRAALHGKGGGDPIAINEMQALSPLTILNAVKFKRESTGFE
jgi:hypothetical protein